MNHAKIHPTLLNEMTMTARAREADVLSVAEEELPVIVRLRPSRSLDAFSVLGEGSGLRVERRLDLVTALAGAATRTEIEALSDSEAVEIIWYDEPVYALLDTSVPLIGVPAVWEGGRQGEGIRICIVDTGVDPEHPDIKGRLAASQDFTGEGPGDRHGHGTHVAATAAGSGAGSNGRYRGVAPRATILAAKVLRGDGSGRMSFVMGGIEWAVEQGAQVINLSLGSPGSSDGSDATSAACDAAVERGAVVVVAAGNEGPGSNTIGSPGSAHRVITVGAATDDYKIADFSSRGPTRDGRTKPDVVLPGVNIIAARASGTALGRPLDALYTSVNGTSMATPHAAGIAALVLEANPSLRPADVKRIFMEAARSFNLDANHQGKGLVMANRAVELARGGQQPAPGPSPTPAPSPTPQPPDLTPIPDPNRPRPVGPSGCFGPAALFARLFGTANAQNKDDNGRA